MTLTLKTEIFFFFCTTLAHDAASSYQAWRQNALLFRRLCLDKLSLTFGTFAVTLILNVVIQIFDRTFQLLLLYYQSKSDCKQTNNLEDMVKKFYFYHIGPHCHLDIEESEPIFLHDTLSHDTAFKPYQL